MQINISSKFVSLSFSIIINCTFSQSLLNVPEQFSTIQQALNVAQTGDTVLVQPGIYHENISWPAVNGIKLISAGDTTNTIIDGRGVHTVIRFNYASIDTNTLIKGFQIRNGANVSLGAGIRAPNINGIRLENLLIYSNNASNSGGGVYITGSTCTYIENCIIRNNQATENGGGVYTSGKLIINNSRIEANRSGSGGGIHASSDTLTISNSHIIDNGAGFGGCIYFDTGQLYMDSCAVERNLSNIHASLWFMRGFLKINKSLFTKNRSYFGDVAVGGAIMIQLSDFEITNSIFYQNESIEGAAIYCIWPRSDSSLILNNLFYENNSPSYGPQTAVYDVCTAIFRNNTFVNNDVAVDTYNSLFVGNNFIKNNFGIKDGLLDVTAINNYWGHESGPYHIDQNPQGLGDSVEFLINVIPFLATPNTNAPIYPVQNITHQILSPTSVKISWDFHNSTKIMGYKFYFNKNDSGFPYMNYIDIGNHNECTIESIIPTDTYYYSITAYDSSNQESWYSSEKSFITSATRLQNDQQTNQLPKKFNLSQNYPNPFNPTTKISYSIPYRSYVKVDIFNSLGQHVKRVVDEEKEAGSYEIAFDSEGLTSGVYFYQLITGKYRETKKMLLLR